MSSKIKTNPFFFEWKGHPVSDVAGLHKKIVELWPAKPIIYLAGDSSLDNKYWVPSSSGPNGSPLPVEIPEIYQVAFDPPSPKPDVAFWLNHALGERATTLNLAVEESMLRERDNVLLEHDEFIRDNIRAQDILIVSIGANDIALRPTFATVRHMLKLAWFTPRRLLEQKSGSGLGYLTSLFKDQIEAYVSQLVEKQKPRAVVVCMIYYPLEAAASKQKSWADLPLKALGYNSYPGQLQAVIRAMYDLATKSVKLDGTEVVPCPLFEVMDGKCEEDYVARVEPSSDGGRKMASLFKGLLKEILPATKLARTVSDPESLPSGSDRA